MFCQKHKTVKLDENGKCLECMKKYVESLDITPPSSGGIGPPTGMPAAAGENIAVCPFPVDPQAPAPGETQEAHQADHTETGGNDGDGGNGD